MREHIDVLSYLLCSCDLSSQWKSCERSILLCELKRTAICCACEDVVLSNVLGVCHGAVESWARQVSVHLLPFVTLWSSLVMHHHIGVEVRTYTNVIAVTLWHLLLCNVLLCWHPTPCHTRDWSCWNYTTHFAGSWVESFLCNVTCISGTPTCVVTNAVFMRYVKVAFTSGTEMGKWKLPKSQKPHFQIPDADDPDVIGCFFVCCIACRVATSRKFCACCHSCFCLHDGCEITMHHFYALVSATDSMKLPKESYHWVVDS